jgi:hypothetical protein
MFNFASLDPWVGDPGTAMTFPQQIHICFHIDSPENQTNVVSMSIFIFFLNGTTIISIISMDAPDIPLTGYPAG